MGATALAHTSSTCLSSGRSPRSSKSAGSASVSERTSDGSRVATSAASRPPYRQADEVDGTRFQCGDESGQIGRMHVGAVLLASVRPRAGTVIPQRVGDVAMILRERGALRLPEAQIPDRAVNEHDRRALALVDERQIDAVGLELTRLGRGCVLGEDGHARRHRRCENEPEGSVVEHVCLPPGGQILFLARFPRKRTKRARNKI